MRYFKLPAERQEPAEYYIASGDEEPFWWYSFWNQCWMLTLKEDTWATWRNPENHSYRTKDIIEVSKLEVLVVIGSFPNEVL